MPYTSLLPSRDAVLDHARVRSRSPKHLILSAALVVAVIVSTAVPVAADQSTATIRVSLAASVNREASIAISSLGDSPRRLPPVTTVAGSAIVRALPPGRYLVHLVTPEGLRADVEVDADAGEDLVLTASRQTASSGVVVRVTDRTIGTQAAIFRARQIADLAAGTDLWALLDTAAPFITVDRFDTGGIGTGSAAYVGSRGASWTATALSWGDLDIPGPAADAQFPFDPDFALVEAFTVGSGHKPADIGTHGVFIAMAPKRPGRTRRATVDVSFTSPGLVAVNEIPIAPSVGRIDSYRNIGTRIETPIGERAALLASASFRRADWTERNDPYLSSASVASIGGHLVAAPTERDEVRALVGLQRISRPFDGRRQFASTDVDQNDTFGHAEVTWERWRDGGARLAMSGGFVGASFTPKVAAGAAGGALDRAFEAGVPAPAAAAGTTAWNGSVVFDIPAVRALDRAHGIRVGFTVARTATSSDVVSAPPVAELVEGIPARVWLRAEPDNGSARRVTDIAAFVTDRVVVTNRLTVEAGLRADFSSGSAEGAEAGISWGSIAPRAALRWTPPWLTVVGGYGRYVSRVSTDLLAFGDPGEPGTAVHRWHDADGDGMFTAPELGVLVARAGRGPSLSSINPELRRPSADEFTLTAERRVGRYNVVRGTAVWRHERSLPRSVNVGVPLSAYTTFRVPDRLDGSGKDDALTIYNRLPASFGQDRYLLTNVDDDFMSYEGIEVAWELNSPRWYSMAGAIAYRGEGSLGSRGFRPQENDHRVLGEVFENPNAGSFSFGRLFFDRAYVLKWSTSYRAPHDMIASIIARYEDGQPFARYVLAPDLNQGAEMVAAYWNGRTRFTFRVTADIRLEKGFMVGGRRSAVRLDVFNLTNHANEVDENVMTGPRHRDITAVQPPRTLRLGIVVGF